MLVFLIVLAVLALIIIAVCSLTATVTLVYDKGWSTRVKVLFIEKDIILTKLLSFFLFPEKAAQNTAEADREKKSRKEKEKAEKKAAKNKEKIDGADAQATPDTDEKSPTDSKQLKPNPIKKIWDDEGIVGIMTFATNLIETANSAVVTLIRGLHIYSLYVMIIVGGTDADITARTYGKICKYYYPLKGIILNGMKVDRYDDYIQPDFIANKTEAEFQLIAGISVGLLLKAGLKAGFIFLKNLIKNKEGD